MIYVSNNTVRDRINYIEELPHTHQKILESKQIWENLKQDNATYSNSLNLVNNTTEASHFDVLKDQLEKLMHY
ncbi:unnamed protein product [Adineta steineri]|uniref:Uncharacterized protein n=1 Tax=Adineta steineri TaxID=433720 RepID=A0A815H3R8_9BILA|nr:unnamed protein product [Adineta steineri]CAF4144860.1 unnamed protein product [Adineta steineri]